METASKIISELDEDTRQIFLTHFGSTEIAKYLEIIDSDDGADILSELSPKVRNETILSITDKEKSKNLKDLLQYDDDVAGGLMAKELVKCNINWKINQCIDLDKINQLLETVSYWYFEQGYVTSRAYVAAQDLSSEHLVITVVEGTIETIRLIDPLSRINTSIAFPIDKDKRLNLRDIEQGLEQINRLQSIQSTMDIVPGQTPGSSVIQVNSQTSKPWVISLSRDNSGQQSTGELMNSLFLSLDNPLGLNDYSYLSVQKDNANASDQDSTSVSWHWDMPIGYWNMGLDMSYFDYLSTVNSIATQFETSGKNVAQTLFLSRILYRDQDSKIKLRTSLERKKSENFIEDVLLDNSRVLSIGNIGIEYDKYSADQSQWQLALNYYRGLSLFGAPNDDHRLAGAPKAQFDKFVARIDYQQYAAFTLSETRQLPLLFQSKLQLQYSPDLLFGSEQVSIGSLYTVRGYKNSSIAASSGAYWRNTLTFPFQPKWGGKLVKQLNPFIAFDIGTIRDRSQRYSDDQYTQLMGWTSGIQVSGKHYSINLSYARPHNVPNWLAVSQEQWHFNLSLKY